MKGDTSNPRLALAGRQREAALLWSRFETAIGGRCDVTCVTGEPGIGKTRLLEEMAARAARSGAVVLWGDASAAEGMPPYLPFLEALGQHIQVTAPGRLRDQVGPAASILVTILPELAVRLGEFPDGYPLPAEMAFHFSRSDDRARGIDYSRRAAEQALRACAPREAMAHYQAALDLLEPDDERRGDLLLALGEAALPAAAAEQAISACQAAQAWFEHTGDLAPAACAAHILGLAYRRMGAPLAAQAALERSLALLEHAGAVGSETVHVLADLADLLGVVLGRHEEALINGQRALEIAQRLGDDRLEAAAGRAVGFLLVRRNDVPAGLPLLERGLALAEANGDLTGKAFVGACAWRAPQRLTTATLVNGACRCR